MKTVLITGASGFVGKNLMEYLTKKLIICQKFIKADFEGNIQLPKEAATIIHLAGKAHDTKNTSAAEEYFEVNTDLTKRIFDAFIASPSTTFIFMSSVKAAADSVNGVLYENAEAEPATPYGQSKRAAERYLLSKELPPGKIVFILRPCMIHGPGNKGNLNLLYNIVSKGIPYPLAAYQNRRSFLSIANLNFTIEKLIVNPTIPGGIYNIADDEPLSTNKLIEIIAQAAKRKPKFLTINKRFINALALIGDKLKLPLNTERLKKLTESYVVSNAKIKEALKVDHLPVSVEDGLKLTFESFNRINQDC